MQLVHNPSRVQLEKILLVTDFPPWSDVAVPYALTLTREHGAETHIAHPVSSHMFASLAQLPQGGPFRGPWRDLVFGAAERQAVVETESMGPRLRQIAGGHEFDLIVISARRPVTAKTLASALEHVFESSACPVMVIGPRVQDPPRAEPGTILYATDFSPHALAAAQHAFGWAQEYQSWITMLHVVEGVSPWTEHERSALEEPFRQWMQQLVPEELPVWCEVEQRVEFGNAPDTIVRTADDLHADLVVIGLAGIDGPSQSVPGSTAYRVIAEAPCPVLVTRDYMKHAVSEPFTNDRRFAAVAA